jgi:hypothetical protein
LQIPEINLNGGIVSNKGFIEQMMGTGIKIIDGKYVSAWGGIQSAGQTVGQIVWLSELLLNGLCSDSLMFFQLLQYATEKFGRKIALYIIWVDLVIVSIYLAGRALSATKFTDYSLRLGIEHLHRDLCDALGPLACSQVVFRHGCGHVAIYVASLPV